MPREELAGEQPKQPLREVTREELSTHDGRPDVDGVWTSINGTVYDITVWRTLHPGGKVIRLAAGREAATLVESYHTSASMKAVTAALANKCQIVGHLKGAEPLADQSFFQEVRTEVEKVLAAKGYGRVTPLLSFGELSITLLLYLYATYQVSVLGSFPWAVALGLLTGRLGFIMHSGNHQAMSRIPALNWIGGAMMDLIGSTHLLWSYEHQVAHHMDPNVFGKDNDCEIGNPHVRFHPAIERKWWHRFNHIVTIAAMSIGFFKWFIADPFHYVSKTVGHVTFHVGQREWIGLIIAKIAWGSMHIIAPYYFCSFWRATALLFTFMVIGGYYLESIFIVNHIQDECVPPTNSHWASKQVLSTANWASGSHLWNFVSGGLNHQIEHHLFPSHSIYLYPLMSPIVKRVCEKHGLPYKNFHNFPAAYMAMVTYLKELGTEKFDGFKVKNI